MTLGRGGHFESARGAWEKAAASLGVPDGQHRFLTLSDEGQMVVLVSAAVVPTLPSRAVVLAEAQRNVHGSIVKSLKLIEATTAEMELARAFNDLADVTYLT